MKNVNESFSPRFAGLFLIAILLTSFSTLGFGLSVSALAAKNLESCSDTQILGVSASASDKSFPASAVLDLNPQRSYLTANYTELVACKG